MLRGGEGGTLLAAGRTTTAFACDEPARLSLATAWLIARRSSANGCSTLAIRLCSGRLMGRLKLQV